MNNHNSTNPLLGAFLRGCRTLSSLKGNVLVYLIVVVLIFGVLGVTIVSLFTSATTSSATPNEARRAYYLAESGIRYALNRIRNSAFNSDLIQNLNDTTSYNLTRGGSFTINIFSPWFEYTSINGNELTLDVPNAGEIPKNFSIPNITLVSWNDFRSNPPNAPPLDSYKPIEGFSATAGDPNLRINITNSAPSFSVSTDDIVCLAVQPLTPATDPFDTDVQEGDDIFVALDARDVFPLRNGAIRIVTDDGQQGEYYYTDRIDELSDNRIRLTNLSALPGAPAAIINPFSNNDWVVLSLHNYRLLATGTAGDVTEEVGNNNPLNIFRDAGVYTITMEDLVADAVTKESNIATPVFNIDAGADKKIIIGDTGSGDAFGNLWYGGEKPIGGDSTFCQEGRCRFDQGIRVFFSLDVTDSGAGGGEGFIFALISAGGEPPDNTINSAGGDFQRSELLGYAGDSRTVADGSVTVGDTGNGLLPPKIGLEFDTRTNFDNNFEQTLDYCSDATTLISDTRNDPRLPGITPNDTHAVQNVFWGDTVLDIAVPDLSCRQNDMTYDDNKHEAEDIRQKWTFAAGSATGNPVRSSPAIGDDGTIYVGSNDNNVYAVNPDGTAKDPPWPFTTGRDVISGPAVGDDGTIYVGSDDNNLYAINPDGTEKWRFSTGDDVKTTPSIGPDGTIYAGSNDNRVYAFNPDTGPPPLWSFNAGSDISLGPIGIGPTGSINFSSRNARTYAINTSGNLKWVFDTGDISDYNPGVDPNDGTVYSDIRFDRIVAIEAEDTDADGTGNEKWRLIINADVDSTPTVIEDGTIYFGSDGAPNAVFALDPANRSVPESFPTPPEWTFSTGGEVDTNPAVGPDGTIFVAANDNKLYALNPDVNDSADREKFSFPINGPFIDAERSSPAVNQDNETVYVGSEDGNLYAFNQIAEPRNFKGDPDKEQNDPDLDPDIDNKLIISDDFSSITFTTPSEWLKEGPWAVRMEVTRSNTADADGNFAYTLKIWVEQCQTADCSDFLSLLFRDTLVEYNVAARSPKLEQTILLDTTDQQKFERFLFGFTTAVQAGDTQQSIIRNFELSFSRPGDPVVTVDPIP